MLFCLDWLRHDGNPCLDFRGIELPYEPLIGSTDGRLFFIG
jgi:hypothetical protein